MNAVVSGVFRALFEGPWGDPASSGRSALVLAALLDLEPGSPASSARDQLVLERGRPCSLDSEVSALLVGDEHLVVLSLLVDGRVADAAALLQGSLGPERLVRLVLEEVHGYLPGSPAHELLVDLVSVNAPSRLVSAALSALESFEVLGRPLSPGFLRFFRAAARGRVDPFVSLAALSVVEANLSAAQEEVFFTLALDGVEYHDAARMAQAVS